MERAVRVKFIRAGTLFKILFTGFVISGALFFIVVGVAGCFGGKGIKIDSVYYNGMKGLLLSPFAGAFFGAIFAIFGWLFTYAGLRVFGWFHPLTVSYEDLTGPPLGSLPAPPVPNPERNDVSITP